MLGCWALSDEAQAKISKEAHNPKPVRTVKAIVRVMAGLSASRYLETVRPLRPHRSEPRREPVLGRSFSVGRPDACFPSRSASPRLFYPIPAVSERQRAALAKAESRRQKRSGAESTHASRKGPFSLRLVRLRLAASTPQITYLFAWQEFGFVPPG